MLQKKLMFFIGIFCLFGVNAYAKDVSLPVDTVALNAALSKIYIVDVDETDENKVAAKKADFYLYFMENKGKKLSSKVIVQQCKKFIVNSISCQDFIETYNSYLNDANACLEANNMEVTANTSYGWQKYKFKECYSIAKGTSTDIHDSYDAKEKCNILVEKVEKCVTYLKNLYSQKKQSSQYNCVLNDLNEGSFELPLTQERLERECDESYQRIKAESNWEMLNSI